MSAQSQPCVHGPWTVLLRDGVRRLLRQLDVDKAVFFGILTKIWGMGAGPVTALLVAARFSPECQGYYYTFSSLLALQVFVELGLSTVVIQFASHEWSRLRLEADGHISGDAQAFSRLVSLADIVLKWYVISGALISFGLGTVGSFFFLSSQASRVDWFLPWISLCVLTGLSICLIPIWALLEGCNQVAVLYTYRFFQGVVSSAVIWAAIFFGAELWAASLSVLAMLACATAFLYWKYRVFIKTLLLSRPFGARIRWKEEIFPMQWRIALSWISGYFVFSLFTPMIFHYHGAVAAGQFGMTWSVVGVISMIASAWVPPKVPLFGMLIAKKDYIALDALFARVVRVFTVISLSAAACAWLAIYFLNMVRHPFAARLLSVESTGVFLAAQVLMGLSYPFSAYLRAHKKEPLLFISVGAGAVIAVTMFILGKYASIMEMGIAYLAINVVLFPLIILIWYRCCRAWHAPAAGEKGS